MDALTQTKQNIIQELEKLAFTRHQKREAENKVKFDSGPTYAFLTPIEWLPWSDDFKTALLEESLKTLQNDLKRSRKV